MERTLRIFPSTVENLFIGPRLLTRGAIEDDDADDDNDVCPFLERFGHLREGKPPDALKKDYEDDGGWRPLSRRRG